jgi:hypothetical protein
MTDKMQERFQARSRADVAGAVRPDIRLGAAAGALLQLQRRPHLDAARELVPDASRRELRPPSSDMPLRPIFLLVEEFRIQCRLGVEPHRLGAVLNATIRFARHGLTLAEEASRFDPSLVAGNERCLHDLDLLLRSLLDNDPPPRPELLHAMDALIVQLVLIDSLRHAETAGSQ